MKNKNQNQNAKFKRPRKGKWVIISVTILLGLLALWTINRFAQQIRKSEQEKVSLLRSRSERHR